MGHASRQPHKRLRVLGPVQRLLRFVGAMTEARTRPGISRRGCACIEVGTWLGGDVPLHSLARAACIPQVQEYDRELKYHLPGRGLVGDPVVRFIGLEAEHHTRKMP